MPFRDHPPFSCLFSRLLAGFVFGASMVVCAAEPPGATDAVGDIWTAMQSELRPGMSDEQKAIVIAEWVSSNSTNQPPLRDAALPFYGLCRERTSLFLWLARRAGLEAARVQFGRFADAGHAAVEVRYGGQWHYFDVTYAGYFRKDGAVLSLDQIRADPAGAIAGMVVFPRTHDRWSDGRNVDNDARMRQNYTPENIDSMMLLPTM